MSFKIVGYQPDWSADTASIPYSRLTHICYAFALPVNASGGIALGSTTAANRLRDVVGRAHTAGTKVLLSVYGGLAPAALQAVRSANSTSAGRSAGVRSIMRIVEDFNLDGVDMDWEYPTGQGSDFAALMATLRGALPGDKLLSAAVIAGANFSAGLAIQRPVFDIVDWLGIMTYDDNLAGQPHASYDFMVQYCNQWLARGLPADKLVAGIPFYARPSGTAYRTYVTQDRANADRDVVSGSGYNGRPTVRRKTQWALANAAGVMFWELSQDTRDDTSLVTTAHLTAGQSPLVGDWFTECFGGTA